MLENDNLRHDILLTFQVALLGMVTPTLRGITVGWDQVKIFATCFYDDFIGDVEIEIASEIEAEVMASFPDHEVAVTAEIYNYPAQLNKKTLGAWVYSRKEG